MYCLKSFRSLLTGLLVLCVACTLERPPQPDLEPPGRNHPAAAYDAGRGRAVLFGGVGASRFGDTWEWDGARWRQRMVEGPQARAAAAMVYDPRRRHTLLFGGGAASGALGDTWIWDGITWTRLSVDGPEPRACHRMVYDSRRNRVVLYGGSGGAGKARLTDTWEWDGAAWRRVATEGPPGSCFHAMAYDEKRGRVVAFGGRGDDGGTWEWDGRSWVRVASDGPPSRDQHAMAFDAAQNQVVLFGGSGHFPDGRWDGAHYDDTWAFDGATWRRLPVTGAPGRGGAPVLLFDSKSNRLLLYGGVFTHSDSPAEQTAHLWTLNESRWIRAPL